MLYIFNCQFRAIGRMIEICFWPLAIGIAFTLLYPIAEVQLVNLFPMFENVKLYIKIRVESSEKSVCLSVHEFGKYDEVK